MISLAITIAAAVLGFALKFPATAVRLSRPVELLASLFSLAALGIMCGSQIAAYFARQAFLKLPSGSEQQAGGLSVLLGLGPLNTLSISIVFAVIYLNVLVSLAAFLAREIQKDSVVVGDGTKVKKSDE
ncbi:hypothetical protein ABDB81_16955 [Cupriavidus sp. DL-D2]